jgi:hypothetical protein
MMNQKVTPLGYLNLLVPGTSPAVGFSGASVSGTTAPFVIPTAANMVVLIAETGQVRWRDDATNPNVTNGMPMAVTSPPPYFEYSGNLSQIRFVGITGTVAVDASFYQTVG